MKIILHGAAREVGRSCVEIKVNGERYVFDAGVKFKENGLEYPEGILNYPSIDGLFISHAHLDHTGALPLFEHNNILCPVFCTKLTYELTKILLKDSYKIARIRHLHQAYEKTDLKRLSKSVRFINYDRAYKHRDLKFCYRNAGHIPGSAMIELRINGKKILYTGDYKITGTEVMEGAYTGYKDVDVLITESTYGNRSLPPRHETREKYLDRIDEVTTNGGSVLLPAFSLGRAQDILIMLSERKFKVPIYYEGMLAKASKKIVESTQETHLKNKKVLEIMLNKVAKRIRNDEARLKAIKARGVFVTTSGMLQGGPVLSYLKEMWSDAKSAVFLSGFQCKRTNGRHLYEDGYVYIDGWKTVVKCQVEKFDFTGHATQEELHEFIKGVNPKVLILNHGDAEAADALFEWAQKNTTCKVYSPKIGEVIIID
jgi:putative mRNA 3-end processing factor